MADETKERQAAGVSLAGPQLRRAGDFIPGTMRRIGPRHAVVTKAVTAEVIDVGSIHALLARNADAMAKARRVVAQLDAERTQLETKLAQFEAAPVQRLEGDPHFDVDAEAETERAPDVSPAEDKPAPSPTPAADKRG